MNLKYLLTLAIVMFSFTFVSAQKKKDITTAEEMVVFNKKNNNDQYKDLVVVYNYELKSADAFKIQDLKSACATRFTQVIKTEVVSEGKQKFLRITTEGTTQNNPIYYEILKANPAALAQARREMLLK